MTPELNGFYEAAKKGDDTALGALADKLEEDNHPLAPLYRSLYNDIGKEKPSHLGQPAEVGGHFNHIDGSGHLVQHGFYIDPRYPNAVSAWLWLGGWSHRYSKAYHTLIPIEHALEAVNFLKNQKTIDTNPMYGRNGELINEGDFADKLLEDYNRTKNINYLRDYSKVVKNIQTAQAIGLALSRESIINSLELDVNT